MVRNPKSAGVVPPKVSLGRKAASAPPSPAPQEPPLPPFPAAAAAVAAAAAAAAAQHDPAGVADPAAELTNVQQKRSDLAEQLREVERQIYDLESKYLEGCNPAANALRGYEALLSQPVQQYEKPAGHVRAEDRLFSGSSLTGWAHLPGAP